MISIPTGDPKLLAHQLSIYFLAIQTLACLIAGSVYGIPYQDAAADAEWDTDWSDLPKCNNETSNATEECACSAQFLWNPWGSIMHAFLYFLMTIMMGYLCTNTLRSGREGNMFASPPVFSLWTSLAINFSVLFYFAWIFTWNSEDWTGAVVVMFFAGAGAWAGLVTFSLSLSSHVEELNHYTPVDRWIYVILVQNTLALMATWFLSIFFVNFAVALVYQGGVSEPQASESMIITLTFLIAICAPMDMMLCDKIFRYVISPLIVFIWVLSAIYDRLKDDLCHDATVRVYTVVLLTLLILVFVGRVLLLAWRHIRKPLTISQ